ncbi:hypothetical protein Efla_006445 [Eimeria flavescens]
MAVLLRKRLPLQQQQLLLLLLQLLLSHMQQPPAEASQIASLGQGELPPPLPPSCPLLQRPRGARQGPSGQLHTSHCNNSRSSGGRQLTSCVQEAPAAGAVSSPTARALAVGPASSARAWGCLLRATRWLRGCLQLLELAYEISSSAFDAKQYFNEPKDAKRNDRYTHFAVAASKLALQDAGLESLKGVDPCRFGVVIGSGIGGLGFMEQQNKVLLNSGPRRVSPYLIPAMIANTAPAQVAIELGAKGPNHGAVSACATSGHAIGTALRLLEMGDADMVLCGGAEASITPLSFAGFNALKALALGYNDRPKEACRPFDKHRAGFVMGEGAGVILLETEEHAVRRGASRVYAQLAGYGATCDAHHITAPAPGGEGLARCMQLALQRAGVAPEDVKYVNAHGTSTHYNDKLETAALKTVFGEHARKLLISSTKPMTGHCLGGTGGIETVVAAKVLETGSVPPTLNYQTPDEECDLNYVPNKAVHVQQPFKVLASSASSSALVCSGSAARAGCGCCCCCCWEQLHACVLRGYFAAGRPDGHLGVWWPQRGPRVDTLHQGVDRWGCMRRPQRGGPLAYNSASSEGDPLGASGGASGGP